jgi:hypothetical protein
LIEHFLLLKQNALRVVVCLMDLAALIVAVKLDMCLDSSVKGDSDGSNVFVSCTEKDALSTYDIAIGVEESSWIVKFDVEVLVDLRLMSCIYFENQVIWGNRFDRSKQ